MKYLLTILMLSGVAYAQTIPGYNFRNSRERTLAQIMTDGLHAPASNGFPVAKTGVWVGDGQIMIDTVNNRYYFYTNGVWRRLVDSSYVAVIGGLTNVGSGYRIYAPHTPGIKTLTATNIALDTSTAGQIGITGGFGVSGADNNATGNRSFDASRNSFTIDSLGSYTIRSQGTIADSATFRIQINRATEKHLLSEYTEPNGVRFAKVELGTDDPSNVYIINEVRNSGVSVFSTILESADSSMTTAGYKKIFTIDSLGVNSGIFINALKTAPSATGMQMLVRDSTGFGVYRMNIPSSSSGVSQSVITDTLHNYWKRNGNTGVSGASTGSFIGTVNAVSLRLKTNNTLRMRIDSSTGGVVISGENTGFAGGAETAGGGILTMYSQNYPRVYWQSSFSGVTSTDGGQIGINIGGSDNNFYMLNRENADIIFLTNGIGNERARITSTGNFGVGDASPASLLTVGASDAFQVNSSGKMARYAASAITDGQLLIGHTSNGTFEKATLTAGTGMTITNGAGTITLTPTNGFTDATTSTSNATPTTIATIATSSNEFGVIEVTMVGHRTTSDGHGITGKKIVRYRNIAGTITVGSITSSLTDELTGLTTATWTITSSGANILIQVTGEAATNIDWSAKYVQTKQVFNP